ncbi:TPA: hypothetical protein N0F65_010791 [Lagenidium giganteum]|uniref:J domain-containing protein n=1 Tax=Lagenidium giganteum TaxID=4803 RepID=A0AAV2YQT3_9STRA|nr:TPA: hypothetical protein N0F65_010791 [Lagenidium giganteum]
MDHYRVLNVARSASAKEIKAAYLRLAKTLHPDVTGNDKKKAEVFKTVTEAYAVLADTNKRRAYDATFRSQSFARNSTHGATTHPYAATGGAPDLRARPLHGLNEEVWIAHHYGAAELRRNSVPGRMYGAHIAEERKEQEEERIRRRTQHYKLHSSAAYFMRRDERIKKHAAKEAKEQEERSKAKKDDSTGECVIS